MSSKPTSRPYLAAILFLSALSALAFVFFNFPPLTSEQKAKLKLPQSIDDVKELGEVISEYKDSHYYNVMLGFSLCADYCDAIGLCRERLRKVYFY
jgi:cytochrome oxidase Cu insertion factor (SCO1/SenC/PrrC family)